MTATALTQNDVYTPEEANAFHEGFTDATLARFNETDGVPVSDSILTPAEANAYFEGVQAGKAKFVGTAYLVPAE